MDCCVNTAARDQVSVVSNDCLSRSVVMIRNDESTSFKPNNYHVYLARSQANFYIPLGRMITSVSLNKWAYACTDVKMRNRG